MALFGDLSNEALSAKKIAANLSRLLPDFTTAGTSLGEDPFIERQENHLRRAVEAADIVAIAMACHGGRVRSKDLPFFLSNPIIAKASTLFLSTKGEMNSLPITANGELHGHFVGLIHELTRFYGQGEVDLDSCLKQDFVEWREMAAVIRLGVDSGLLSAEDVPYALSDSSVLPYVVKALQLKKIMGNGFTLER
ncbi:MAG: hypothetical protein RL518_2634 [Pseudomonadota bacterium]|jgi:hypothetical protein